LSNGGGEAISIPSSTLNRGGLRCRYTELKRLKDRALARVIPAYKKIDPFNRQLDLLDVLEALYREVHGPVGIVVGGTVPYAVS
jgi:hypothetical protein